MNPGGYLKIYSSNAISEKMMIHEADLNGGQSILRARLGLTAKGELSFVDYLSKVSQSGSILTQAAPEEHHS
jgi:hypothetical protein